MNEALWPGPFGQEAVRAFHRATDAGMSTLRALVVGCVGSFKDCWMFQRQLAQRLGCSRRTIQRALRQARQLGLIECHRSKRNERPPGVAKPVECGFSHRWAIGWGRALEAAKVAVKVARVAVTIPGAFRRNRKRQKATQGNTKRRWTASEIEAELARRRGPAPPE